MDSRKSGSFMQENIFLLISALVIFATLLYFLIPFILYNNLVSWDFAGLYFSTWYQKEYIAPGVVGWNPYFFLGYPQNQFYPPLFTYITGVLALIMPVEYSFKLIFALSIVLLPVSFYFFARSFGIGRNNSGVITLLMFAILFIFPDDLYGGNMHATFHIGLITHELGMALFFFYWGLLQRNFGRDRVILASFVLSGIVLTHIIAAFASVFLLIAYILIRVRSRKDAVYPLVHGLLSFALTAFWTIPFIAKNSWLDAYPIGLISHTYLFLFGAMIYILVLWKREKEAFYPIGLFVVILISFSAFSQAFFNFPVHLYRFMMYIYLLIPISLFSIFRRINIKALIALFIIGTGMILFAEPIDTRGPDFLIKAKDFSFPEKERIFVFAPFSKQPSPHLLQNMIPLSYNQYGVRGLYVESAKNARYISNLENSLAIGDSPIWGIYANWDLISNNTSVLTSILPYQLKIFNVKYIVSWINYSVSWNNISEIAVVKGFSRNSSNISYFLFRASGDSKLIEVLDYMPRVVYDDWDFKTARWFLSDEIRKGILVNEAVPSFKGRGDENITIIEMSRRQDYLHFYVDSEEPVPILIKISYFPNWKAYSNGIPIKIYRASPYIMLVYGHGNIELKYERLPADYMGLVISLTAFISLIVYFFARKR